MSTIFGHKSPYLNEIPLSEVELADGETFEQYVERIDKNAPFGRDPNGIAHLFPMGKHKGEVAYRPGMKPHSDWAGLEKFKKSGIIWDLNPTFLIGLMLFLPMIIGLPIIYLIYTGDFNIFMASLRQEAVTWSAYLIFILVFHIVLKYSSVKLESLLKPYGKDYESIKLLFKDELEYLKFSKKFFNSVYNMKWILPGAFVSIIFLATNLPNALNVELWNSGLFTPIPDWSRFLLIPAFLGMGIIILFLIGFVSVIICGLFLIANLGSDRSKLSITKFGEMILSINNMVAEAQIKKLKISNMESQLNISGRTFYEFQRANRKIGEFLFNVAALLIFISVLFGILLWLAQSLNLLPEGQKESTSIIALIITIFGILSFAIFLLPQLKVHSFLKKFKYYLVDLFASLTARFEYLYFEAMIHPDLLQRIDENWKSRKDILKDIHILRNIIEEIKNYGTWSYDFPEILKLLAVAGSTGIPIILSFVKFPFM